MSKITVNGSALERIDKGFTIENGRAVSRVEYVGLREDCMGKVPELLARGAILSGEQEEGSPLFRLFATFPGRQNGQREVPLDRWTISSESAQTSIWAHPDVDAYAKAVETTASGSLRSKLQELFSDDKKATISSGDLSQFAISAANPVSYAQSIYQELKRGVENFDDESVVLRLSRTVSLAYTTKRVLHRTKFIYTTAQLRPTLPGVIAFRLPDAPSPNPTSVNTFWGWRFKGQHTDIIGNTVEHQYEWQFGAHSLLLYAQASGKFVY